MDRKQLLASIAAETGIRVAEDDPVLTVAAINKILLDTAVDRPEKVAKAAADRVTAASAQHLAAARREAELLIVDGGEVVAERLKAAGEAVTAAMMMQLRQETARAEKASQVAVRAVWTTAALTAITLSGLTGIWIAWFVHG